MIGAAGGGMSTRTPVAVAFTAPAVCFAGCQPMAYLMSTLLQILRAEASTVRDGPDDRMTLLYATTDCQRSQLASHNPARGNRG